MASASVPGRAPGRPDDAGIAIIAVLLVLVVVMPIALATVAIVTLRQRDVTYERSRVLTVHAAEAGIDSATAVLRGATTVDPDGHTVGDPSKLPCAQAVPLSGAVAAAVPTLSYTVVIRYYVEDPAGHDEQWRAGKALSCTPGSGPASIPAYALIQSAASGSQVRGSFASLRERSVEAVYRFAQDDRNPDGGLIHTWTHQNGTATLTADLCWDTVDPTPGAGSALKVDTCQYGDAGQLYAYRSDYTVVNLATRLCLSVASDTEAEPATLQPCAGTPGQKWTYDNGQLFRPLTSDGSQVSDTCLTNATVDVAGGALVLTSGCSNDQQWSPDPSVGNGGAGPQQYQLVNLAQSGRCFDVTNVDLDYRFMQIHPCKQNAAGLLDWWPQQVDYDPIMRLLRIGRPDDPTGYCVTSSAQSGGWVTASPCNAADPLQHWTMSGAAATYADSYRILNEAGLCLGGGPPPDPGWTFFPLVTVPCDGSALQKWNAPNGFRPAGLQDYRETTRP